MRIRVDKLTLRKVLYSLQPFSIALSHSLPAIPVSFFHTYPTISLYESVMFRQFVYARSQEHKNLLSGEIKINKKNVLLLHT